MATAQFDESGNIKATGKEAMPQVAEGLGAVNIKGIQDKKAQTDIANEQGHEQVNDTPVTERKPQAGFDAGSGETVTVDHPVSGRTTQTMGNATALSADADQAAYSAHKRK
ncbi:hypothetical protein CVIRNUC_007935 [Coccomyxa viridis]|uniref:Seed maturation protein n=1 Tax=Coccomyxa viridis TaxID=1274662 RepID=A0AAV1IDE3_9CHLO|nr:hypothetical protein CVIRNUC_007935 [Coccomyxa viridis]